MRELRRATAQSVYMGPFISSADGAGLGTPVSIADASIFIIKNSGVDYIDATPANRGATTTAAAGSNSHVLVALGTDDTDKTGRFRVFFLAQAGFLPVWEDFQVLPESIYDAKYGAEAGTDAKTMLALSGVDVTSTTGVAVSITSLASTYAAVAIAGHTTTGTGVSVSAKNGVVLASGTTGSGLIINSSGNASAAVKINGVGTGSVGIEVNAGTSGSAVVLSGDGGGSGIHILGGATGSGIRVVGGSTSGVGVDVLTTSGDAVRLTGGGAGSGINAVGGGTTGSGITVTSGAGATGNGVSILANSTNGFGLSVTGSGTGAGLYAAANGTGHGITAYAAGSGNGISVSSGSGNGISSVGGGTSAGVYVRSGSGATGSGVDIASAATSGTGLILAGKGVGNGATLFSGTGAGAHGLAITTGGTGVSHGVVIYATSATTGSGLSISNGTGATGDAVSIAASTTAGSAVKLAGKGTAGYGLSVVTTAANAIHIAPVGGSGILIAAPAAQSGISITNTTGSAILLACTTGYGFRSVSSAGGSAVDITNSSTGAAINVSAATGYGLNIVSAGTTTGTAVRVYNSSASSVVSAVTVSTASAVAGSAVTIATTSAASTAAALTVSTASAAAGAAISVLSTANATYPSIYVSHAGTGAVSAVRIASQGTAAAVAFTNVQATNGGAGFEVSSTSGVGLSVSAAAGHGVQIAAAGAAKSGVKITSAAYDGIEVIAGGAGHGLELLGGATGNGLHVSGVIGLKAIGTTTYDMDAPRFSGAGSISGTIAANLTQINGVALASAILPLAGVEITSSGASPGLKIVGKGAMPAVMMTVDTATVGMPGVVMIDSSSAGSGYNGIAVTANSGSAVVLVSSASGISMANGTGGSALSMIGIGGQSQVIIGGNQAIAVTASAGDCLYMTSSAGKGINVVTNSTDAVEFNSAAAAGLSVVSGTGIAMDISGGTRAVSAVSTELSSIAVEVSNNAGKAVQITGTTAIGLSATSGNGIDIASSSECIKAISSFTNAMTVSGTSGINITGTAGAAINLYATGGTPAFTATGSGACAGAVISGGLTGNGIEILGGNTSGNGVVIQANVGHAIKAVSQSAGSAVHLSGLGDSTDHAAVVIDNTAGSYGIKVKSGSDSMVLNSTTGRGLVVEAASAAVRLNSTGSNGLEILGAGGVYVMGTSAPGINVHGTGAPAIYAQGGAGAAAIDLLGPVGGIKVNATTGNGIDVVANDTGASAVKLSCLGTDSVGFFVDSAVTGSLGALIFGDGVGLGVYSNDNLNCVGLSISGGVGMTVMGTVSDAVELTCDGATYGGTALKLNGKMDGNGLEINPGATGIGLKVTGGTTSGDAVRVSAGAAGHGINAIGSTSTGTPYNAINLLGQGAGSGMYMKNASAATQAALHVESGAAAASAFKIVAANAAGAQPAVSIRATLSDSAVLFQNLNATGSSAITVSGAGAHDIVSRDLGGSVGGSVDINDTAANYAVISKAVRTYDSSVQGSPATGSVMKHLEDNPVVLATAQPNYAPAKAGDAMALVALQTVQTVLGNVNGNVAGNVGGNVGGSVNSVANDVGGKILGGGVGTITGTGVQAQLAANQDVRNVTGSVAGSVGSVTGAVGSVTGSVGSVAGSVGSVTGAVGSVTAGVTLAANQDVRNVSGSVAGSVGSVSGAVGSVTGSVGSVTGSVGSVTGAVGSVTSGVTLAAAQGLYAPAKAGDKMDIVNVPNATAIAAIQAGLATASALSTVDTNVDTIQTQVGTLYALRPASMIASQTDVLGIVTGTRAIQVATADTYRVPSAAFTAYKIEIVFRDSNGALKNPSGAKEINVYAAAGGADWNGKLYNEAACSNIATVTLGWAQAVSVSTGVFALYLKVASTEVDKQLEVDARVTDSAVVFQTSVMPVVETVSAAMTANLADTDANKSVIAKAIRNFDVDAAVIGLNTNSIEAKTEAVVGAVTTAVNAHTDSVVGAAVTTIDGHTDTATAGVTSAVNLHTDSTVSAAVTTIDGHTDTATAGVTTDVNAHTDTKVDAAVIAIDGHTDTATASVTTDVNAHTDSVMTGGVSSNLVSIDGVALADATLSLKCIHITNHTDNNPGVIIDTDGPGASVRSANYSAIAVLADAGAGVSIKGESGALVLDAVHGPVLNISGPNNAPAVYVASPQTVAGAIVVDGGVDGVQILGAANAAINLGAPIGMKVSAANDYEFYNTSTSETKSGVNVRAVLGQDMSEFATSINTMVIGTVNSGTSSTEFIATPEYLGVTKTYIGRSLIWTSGSLKDSATKIVNYVVSGPAGTFTTDPMLATPGAGDTFIIV